MAIRSFGDARHCSHRRRRLYVDVVTTLLRAGASVAEVEFDIYLTQDRLTREDRDGRDIRLVLPEEPYFAIALVRINDIRAYGSWHAFVMRPRLEVLTLRGLANRGKIHSTDPALNNLVALPNELICQVLAFWFG